MGNPISRVDPTGLCPPSGWWLVAAGVALIFVAAAVEIGTEGVGTPVAAELLEAGLADIGETVAADTEISAIEAASTEGDNLITVVHFTDQAGVNAIESSGALLPGTYVTLPSEVEGLSQAEVEEYLEIQEGRGAFSTTFQVPESMLSIPENGPLTSGGGTQYQLTGPAIPGPFLPTPY
jgi:hypothetical protein